MSEEEKDKREIHIKLPPGFDPRPHWAQMIDALLYEAARQGWRMRNTLEFDGPEIRVAPGKYSYLSIDPEDIDPDCTPSPHGEQDPHA